jgi:hypothetical protein
MTENAARKLLRKGCPQSERLPLLNNTSNIKSLTRGKNPEGPYPSRYLLSLIGYPELDCPAL